MAKKPKARTKYAGTRVDNEMDRFLTRNARFLRVKRSQQVSRALTLYRREAEMATVTVGQLRRETADAVSAKRRIGYYEEVRRVCSCSPDDRAKHGCRCGAEVGR